jgi:hypothetical protein
MTFKNATDRIRAEFIEMPGLELTLPQAVRLWGLGLDDCRGVIDALVDTGFLKWTPRRTVLRSSYINAQRKVA